MKKNNKGFTLAELLIVVAIIAVLVAISVPIFTKQLEKSREAVDIANIRSAYAEIMTTYLTEGSASSMSFSAEQTVDSWQTSPAPHLTYQNGNGTIASYDIPNISANGTINVGYSLTSATGELTPVVN